MKSTLANGKGADMERDEETKTTVLEEGYFHISNSGLTFNLLEHVRTWGDHGKVITWEVSIRFAAFGIETEFKFPILGNAAQYFGIVFTRLHERIERFRRGGDYHCVNRDGPYSTNICDVQVNVIDGIPTEFSSRPVSTTFPKMNTKGERYVTAAKTLKSDVREALYEPELDSEERHQNAVKAKLAGHFQDHPEDFTLATGGMTEEQRHTLIARLEITDEALIQRLLNKMG